METDHNTIELVSLSLMVVWPYSSSVAAAMRAAKFGSTPGSISITS